MNTSLWALHEPTGDGNCATMYKDYRRDHGKYSDLHCRYTAAALSGYICERPVDGCNQEVSTVKQTTSRSTAASKESTTKPSTTQSLVVTSTARSTLSTSQPRGPIFIDSTTTAKAPKGGEQVYDKENCSSVVITLSSLVAMLSAALLIFAVCLLSWRKKQRKDTRNATDTGVNRNKRDDQDGSSLIPENVARQLGFSDKARPGKIQSENQKRQTGQSSRQESGYAMLTPCTMMVAGNSSYASLVKSEKGDCANKFSVVASCLLQLDEEPHEGLPTNVNQMRSSEYMNI